MQPDHDATQVEAECEIRIEYERMQLSKKAYTVYGLAVSAADIARLIPTYGSKPQEYEHAKAEMRRAAAELSHYDRLDLARVGRANLAAAGFIDPKHEDKHLEGGRCLGDCYRHYRTVSDIIEDVLREIAAEEHLKEVEQD